MSKFKSFLSVLAAIILVFSCTTMPVFAAQNNISDNDTIVYGITELSIVPMEARASYATGCTDFQVQGKGYLTLPAGTSVSSVKAFARLASGGANSNVTIKIVGKGFPSSGSNVKVTESYQTISDFTGIHNTSGSSKTYTFTFNVNEWKNHYGIGLYFN